VTGTIPTTGCLKGVLIPVSKSGVSPYTSGFYLLEIYILLFTLINKDRKNTYRRGVKNDSSIYDNQLCFLPKSKGLA
ncbi:hypothetical protein ACQJ18_28355, partial [Priestia megaterium]|uniref:hypothetical protein n=1 Tax=Priestia megaterium TaxID=1404 RepID=UPI003CFDFA2C